MSTHIDMRTVVGTAPAALMHSMVKGPSLFSSLGSHMKSDWSQLLDLLSKDNGTFIVNRAVSEVSFDTSKSQGVEAVSVNPLPVPFVGKSADTSIEV